MSSDSLRGDPRCHVCGNPATCIGAYEGSVYALPACDACCGHGNEDGWCKPIQTGDPRSGRWQEIVDSWRRKATAVQAKLKAVTAERDEARAESARFIDQREKEYERANLAEARAEAAEAKLATGDTERSRLQQENEELRRKHGASLAEIRTVAAEREAVWAAIEHGYDIEPRAYFEKEAPRNGFQYPLVQAFHHIWKREPKVDELRSTLAQVKDYVQHLPGCFKRNPELRHLACGCGLDQLALVTREDGKQEP